MKRNLTKRVFAAAALAVIAAATSSCGSSNNNNGVAAGAPCVAGQICTQGLNGANINTNSPGCTLAFTGTGIIDYNYGGPSLSGSFQVNGQTPGMVNPSAPGNFTAGRISTVDGTTLALTYVQNGSYVTVSGILSLALDEGGSNCSYTQVALQEVGITNQDLGQPFANTLWSGAVGVSGPYGGGTLAAY